MNTQPTIPALPQTAVARAVLTGLSRRPYRLPASLAYDIEGAAMFERLAELGDYYPTRMERQILELHGEAILEQAIGLPERARVTGGRGRGDVRPTLIELGAGTAKGTELLLRYRTDALYMPIDPSPWTLAVAKKRLARQLPDLDVLPFAGSTEDALSAISLMPAFPKVVLYLGSAIGSHDDREAVQLLRSIAHAAGEGAALVLGTDLVKSPGTMLPAYDDHLGLYADFNKNVLARINRELGGRFDLDCWEHVAIWNADHSCVEISLQSLADQAVQVRSLGQVFRFQEGELVHTDVAVKYDLARVGRILRAAGLERERTFLDKTNSYAVHVARVLQQSRRLPH